MVPMLVVTAAPASDAASSHDWYTHVLIEAHLTAAEQMAALIREAGKTAL